MQFLEKLDLAILDGFFQKIADRVNDRWGKSCFWLARVCVWIAIIFLSAACLSDVQPIGVLVALMLGIILLRGLHAIEKNADKLVRNILEARVMNPIRDVWSWLRISYFWLDTFLTIVLLGWWFTGLKVYPPSPYMLGFLWWALGGHYFLACTPKPPSPLKAGNKLAAAAVPSR